MADEDGNFSWARPDEEVHGFVNELERPVGTYLYGRRMYEVMAVWDDPEFPAGEPPVIGEYADIWRSADKVVFSRTLSEARTARTRVERDFDPEAIRRMKSDADRPLSVGGAELAGQALAAGLVDELHLFLVPVVVGGGTRALPDGVRAGLVLRGARRFAGGTVHLHYGVESRAS